MTASEHRYRPLSGYSSTKRNTEPVIHSSVWIGSNVVVEPATTIAEGVVLDHFSYVGYGSLVGKHSLVTYRAWVSPYCSIGSDCVIGGFIGEGTNIGDRCRVFGSIVHHQVRPDLPWDAPSSEEMSADIGDDAFIGFGATIAGGLSVGSGAYVCANSIVTRDVPAFHVASGTNQVVPISEWKGRLRRGLEDREKRKEKEND